MPSKRVTGPGKAKRGRPSAKSELDFSTSQNGATDPSSLLPNPSLKRKNLEPSTSVLPGYDDNVTSRSSREKRRFKISWAALADETINENSISRLITTAIHPNSSSQDSWGVSLDQAIEAPRKKKTGAMLKRFPQGSAAVSVNAFAERVVDTRSAQQMLTTNTPKTSPLLRLSLELREIVYSYLIQYDEPLMVKPDWQTIEINPYLKYPIFFLCKQINGEVTAFIYRSNSIHAVFRIPANCFSLYKNQPYIDSRFISSYRDVIMEFEEGCWDLNALEMKSSHVTFADFLWYPGDFMISLRELAPSKVNIVVKTCAVKRLLVSLDLTKLQGYRKHQALPRNSDQLKTLSAKENGIDVELRSLKEKFEDMFDKYTEL